MDHEHYMQLAIEEAKKAFESGETPVGCIVVDDSNTIVGKGRNRREKEKCATKHAEIEAIANACKTIGDWRLSGCTLYVTLEPCPMCAGAAIMSRISTVVYGARDELTGSCGSIINLFMEQYGNSTKVIGGIMADECSALMTGFFNKLRNSPEKRTNGRGEDEIL